MVKPGVFMHPRHNPGGVEEISTLASNLNCYNPFSNWMGYFNFMNYNLGDGKHEFNGELENNDMISPPPIVNEKDIACLRRLDPIFDQIHLTYGAPPNWSREPGFISLCRIILEQQVSLSSARAHFLKLVEYIGFLTPENILKLTDKEMRTCQISRQKARYLRALSTAVREGNLDLNSLTELDEAAIRQQLTQVTGIGAWTSDIYLLFCLQSRDILPLGDVAIRSAVKTLTGCVTPEDIDSRSREWAPLRSLASFYLWHAYLCSRNRTADFS